MACLAFCIWSHKPATKDGDMMSGTVLANLGRTMLVTVPACHPSIERRFVSDTAGVRPALRAAFAKHLAGRGFFPAGRRCSRVVARAKPGSFVWSVGARVVRMLQADDMTLHADQVLMTSRRR